MLLQGRESSWQLVQIEGAIETLEHARDELDRLWKLEAAVLAQYEAKQRRGLLRAWAEQIRRKNNQQDTILTVWLDAIADALEAK
jgi:hypothetical protein